MSNIDKISNYRFEIVYPYSQYSELVNYLSKNAFV